MKKIGIFYGSSTGTTQGIAETIASKLGVPASDVIDVSKMNADIVKEYEALLLGTSTWVTVNCRMTGMMALKC